MFNHHNVMIWRRCALWSEHHKQAHRHAHYVTVLMFSVCIVANFKIYPLCRVQVDTMPYIRSLESTHPVTLKYCILWPKPSHFSHPKGLPLECPKSCLFSRQEHWSGLPFPSPMHESEKWKGSLSVVSNSSQPHGLQLTGLLVHGIFQAKVLE